LIPTASSPDCCGTAHGAPRALLDAARRGEIVPLTSAVLLDELSEVLARAKFEVKVRASGLTATRLAIDYAQLAHLAAPAELGRTVAPDPDDDAVLACALAAQADPIVSGDAHLLNLKTYHRIPIVTAAEALARLPQAQG
jgi:putative PIN family toxin of toxin-antitoxin system